MPPDLDTGLPWDACDFTMALAEALTGNGDLNGNIDDGDVNGIVVEGAVKFTAIPGGGAPPDFDRKDVKLRCSGLGTLLRTTGGSGSGR